MRSRIGSWLLGLAVFAAAIGFTTVFTAPPASACSCQELTIAEAIEGADVVVIGQQVMRSPGWFGDARMTIAVQSVLAGESGPVLRVRTGQNSADCGADLGSRGVVGILVHEHRDELWVTSCSPVPTVEQVEKHFGVDVAPVAVGGHPWKDWMMLIALATIGVASVTRAGRS